MDRFILLVLSSSVYGQIAFKFNKNDFVELRSEEKKVVKVVATSHYDTIDVPIQFKCSNNESCVIACSNDRLTLDGNNNFTEEIKLRIEGIFIGNNKLVAVIDGKEEIQPLDIRIQRSEYESQVSKVFSVVATFFIVAVTFLIGTQLEFHRMVEIMKKPVGPLCGFFCQFFFMPLIGFGLAYYLLADAENSMKLAFFAVAVSPGGGKSSFWTIIFDGNLDLSVCMTFIETLGAAVMTPLWMYTLGSVFFDNHINVPLLKFIESLAIVLIPTSLGIFSIQFAPHWISKIKVVIKYFTWILVIVLTSVGIYANYYIFAFINWKIVVASCVLPWSGYIIAFLFAVIMHQNFQNAITIAIETGIQNVGIAFTIMLYTFPEFEKDIAMVIPITVVLVTDKPLFLIWLVKKCFFGKKKE
ncbi:unnamed protein product [Bursaphelenchus xylophilus]|uniref:(pine wood nematode) hypothetical protein n=1 Tax=Bursaphelenchus xylophilus TaxID=6326 RepID=A0A1I7RPD6_BURXY|nr:unnamed protein product [Bursaphelenchus xylophilus]CAG9095846.1 unnamed protein product [Bursaphelenchus xylophilus]